MSKINEINNEKYRDANRFGEKGLKAVGIGTLFEPLCP